MASIRPKTIYTVIDIAYDNDPDIGIVDVSTDAYTSGDGTARTIMIRLSTIHQG